MAKRAKAKQQGESPEESLLRTALTRFKVVEEAESSLRIAALVDLEFSVGNQWDDDARNSRIAANRPMLTMNQVPQYLRQITNEQRRQSPAIKINPAGDGASTETAEILQGMMRHIEVQSEAEVAKDHGFEMAVRIGFGYMRVLTEYVEGYTFDQEILIKRVKNPFTVYFDPSAKEHDYSDAKWAFIIEDVELEEFKLKYPKSGIAGLTELSSVGSNAPGWARGKTVRVAEYFYVEDKTETIYELKGGTIVTRPPEEGVEVLQKREVPSQKIKWVKMTALDILAQKDLNGKYIPIIPILGDDLDVNGVRHLSGMVRNMKDPQRMYNFWTSYAAERIASDPKSPWIGAAGQFDGFEEAWKDQNWRNSPYLEYNRVDVDGKDIGPPQRQSVEPPIQAMAMMTAQAREDMRATTGIYAIQQENIRPEQSGRSIIARENQTADATMNYADNLSRSIRHLGRVLVDLIPLIYDTPRIRRIIKPDSSVEQVISYMGPGQKAEAEALLKTNESIKKIYDVGLGRYDVTVSVGPSYQTKRQEAASSLLEFMKVYPAAAPIIGDLVARNMDWVDSDVVADRLMKTLPPGVLDAEDTDPKAQLQVAQAKLQQLEQQFDAMTKALQQANQDLNSKRMEMESKERMNKLDNTTKLLLEVSRSETQGAILQMQAQIELLTKEAETEVNAGAAGGGTGG